MKCAIAALIVMSQLTTNLSNQRPKFKYLSDILLPGYLPQFHILKLKHLKVFNLLIFKIYMKLCSTLKEFNIYRRFETFCTSWTHETFLTFEILEHFQVFKCWARSKWWFLFFGSYIFFKKTVQNALVDRPEVGNCYYFEILVSNGDLIC